MTVVRDADGGPQYFLSQMADIGERRAAEQALAQSEERFRTLASASPVGVFAVAEDGRLAYANERLREIFDMPAGVLDGTPWLARVPAEDRDRLVGEFRRARALGERMSLDVRVAAGIDRWARIHMAPVSKGPDQPTGLVGTIEDVTVEVTARMALAAREAEYRMLAEHSTDFLSRHTIDGTFLYASPVSRAMLGWDSEAMLGRTPRQLELDHPDDMEIIERNWVGALREERPRTAAYRARRRDGSIVWLETIFRAVSDPAGEALEMVCVSRDISERKSAELELAHRALHDALTGLPNRTLFLDRLGQALRRRAGATRGVAVVFLDLDRFKLVNDSLGHDAGDQLLVDVARRISSRPAPVRHARALRRRRVHAALRGHRRRRGRARRSPSACSTTFARALPPRRTARSSCDERRHRDLARRLRGARGPDPRRRRRDVPRQGARQGRRALRRGHAPGRARPARARGRAAPRLERGELRLHYQPLVRSPTRASRASRRSCAGSTRARPRAARRRSSRSPRRRG